MKTVRYYGPQPRPHTADPARGSYIVKAAKRHGPNRPGKTLQDRMAVAGRPRVQAAAKRREAMRRV